MCVRTLRASVPAVRVNARSHRVSTRAVRSSAPAAETESDYDDERAASPGADLPTEGPLRKETGVKKKIKKLELCKETLRTLESREMKQVQGGFSDIYYGTSCYPVACDIDSNPCQ
jgi:natural product precursor